VKKSSKKDKEGYINDVCKAIEESRKTSKSREVYECIRKITRKFTSETSVIKGNDGKMITDAEKVKSRWKDYFEGLYNDPNLVNEATLSQIVENSDKNPCQGILMEEVTRAVRWLKDRKATGADNITAEEIKAATEEGGLQIVHQLLTRIWKEEIFPTE